MTEQTQPTDADLKERCAEIVEWQRTGVLPGNALRNYAAAHWDGDLQMSERDTSARAMELIAKWGTPAGAGEVVAVKAMGYGGSTGINDYLMSDGTVKAMRPAEVRWATQATTQPTQAQTREPLTVQYPEGYGNPLAKIAYDAGWRAAEHAHGIKGADHD